MVVAQVQCDGVPGPDTPNGHGKISRNRLPVCLCHGGIVSVVAGWTADSEEL